MADKDFLKWVQIHERTWGQKQYDGRPTLQQILDAPVVSFWRHIKEPADSLNVTIRLHDSLTEIEHYYIRLMNRARFYQPKERIVRLYQNGHRLQIKHVRIEFMEVPDDTHHLRF